MESKFVFALLLIAAIVASAGCASKEPVVASGGNAATQPTSASSTESNTAAASQPPAEEAGAEVQTIDLGWPTPENWDADAETDGIEFNISPKDSKGDTVVTDGTINAKLYENVGFAADQKGDLIQEWNNIKVSKDNFSFMGAKVRLEYKSGFKTTEPYAQGWLDITFVTPGGKEFNATQKNVFLEK